MIVDTDNPDTYSAVYEPMTIKSSIISENFNYEGKTYFFESEKNLDLFRDNPEKYLGKGE